MSRGIKTEYRVTMYILVRKSHHPKCEHPSLGSTSRYCPLLLLPLPWKQPDEIFGLSGRSNVAIPLSLFHTATASASHADPGTIIDAVVSDHPRSGPPMSGQGDAGDEAGLPSVADKGRIRFRDRIAL
ncbi:hypothetical protein CIHG_06621 [Coccidioides immitis H538.4]|uniref:Uncharacterized protein n=3 Tax=Coccidioides immitis TaxID=5501 RepID=A0A0J8QIU2_COCIT|nr:hypothetical protein CIRG_08036 [Coccidioides immitis RMSCC 2394]KMU72386.1 hypothetical protein CISG_03034 [Coccidioides immitis RMSCC 3703]KMU88680.1 hypothetical protein CIHG_06621 [Coccidioides immitis H538.4]